ncbi:uncharacterized protein YtfP isoform X2 [Tripterygium wilfordii]|uniref:uncharacterized protein YtfP isoform X2 n=1 Tax=Tripterygium wilfordii TaxID=458696 RepID=UPI0018F7E704|nr:uncharacterized protein YtfP isoform X2 [Tripterygium wilfordii]
MLFVLRIGVPLESASIRRNCVNPLSNLRRRRRFTATAIPVAVKSKEELLVVVGGGPAGVYGAIRAKTAAPDLSVVLIEQGKLLTKVKVSGGGRCNVTNGHCTDKMILAENYPRGNKELRGSFFDMHGSVDTMSWFLDHGVALKTEDDGRVFPVSNSSSTIIDCLSSEAKHRGVLLQTRSAVTSAYATAGGKFLLKIDRRVGDIEEVEADYLLIATGSSRQGYSLAAQLGHSIVDPVPSLFTFKIKDAQLTELSGVTFHKVEAKLKLDNIHRSIPQLTQVGPMLVTHWGLSGPVILRLSAWGARGLFSSGYKGMLVVDFMPDLHIEDAKSIFRKHKQNFPDISGDSLWSSISNNSIDSVACLLKHCTFEVMGKGQFKDEFVTAGGVPLSEISLKTMESKVHSRLFFAGEVLDIDGVTGGFNFQSAWSGGYIAGTRIGELAASAKLDTLLPLP